MAPLKDDTLLIPRIVARFSTTNNKVAFRVLLSQGRRNLGGRSMLLMPPISKVPWKIALTYK